MERVEHVMKASSRAIFQHITLISKHKFNLFTGCNLAVIEVDSLHTAYRKSNSNSQFCVMFRQLIHRDDTATVYIYIYYWELYEMQRAKHIAMGYLQAVQEFSQTFALVNQVNSFGKNHQGVDLGINIRIQVLPLVEVEMDPGDALFFHSNILHRSDQNKSDRRRWAFLIAYNRASNDPVIKHPHPNYTKLDIVSLS